MNGNKYKTNDSRYQMTQRSNETFDKNSRLDVIRQLLEIEQQVYGENSDAVLRCIPTQNIESQALEVQKRKKEIDVCLKTKQKKVKIPLNGPLVGRKSVTVPSPFKLKTETCHSSLPVHTLITQPPNLNESLYIQRSKQYLQSVVQREELECLKQFKALPLNPMLYDVDPDDFEHDSDTNNLDKKYLKSWAEINADERARARARSERAKERTLDSVGFSGMEERQRKRRTKEREKIKKERINKLIKEEKERERVGTKQDSSGAWKLLDPDRDLHKSFQHLSKPSLGPGWAYRGATRGFSTVERGVFDTDTYKPPSRRRCTPLKTTSDVINQDFMKQDSMKRNQDSMKQDSMKRKLDSTKTTKTDLLDPLTSTSETIPAQASKTSPIRKRTEPNEMSQDNLESHPLTDLESNPPKEKKNPSDYSKHKRIRKSISSTPRSADVSVDVSPFSVSYECVGLTESTRELAQRMLHEEQARVREENNLTFKNKMMTRNRPYNPERAAALRASAKERKARSMAAYEAERDRFVPADRVWGMCGMEPQWVSQRKQALSNAMNYAQEQGEWNIMCESESE